MSKSTVSRPCGKQSKPAKPYRDFPLYAHASGRWAKKIRGKLHYFGPWRDSEGALQRFLDTKDDLYAGRTPRTGGDGLSIRELCNRFLTVKQSMVDSGELSKRTFADYYRTCQLVIGAFGKSRLVSDLAADDFERFRAELAKARGPVALGNEVQRARVLFKYADDAGLIDRPVRVGPGFKRPSAKTLRLARHANGLRMFEPDELLRIIESATQPLRAMVLLGINCGFGQSDISNLPVSALDFDGAWINYPRPKTGIMRRCPLWPETVEALNEVMATRRKAEHESDADLLFITKYGRRFVRVTTSGAAVDGVAQEMRKLLESLGLKRKRLNFYALRHSFETIAGDTGDQVAVNHIMGHADQSMAAVYRERIADERLQKVVEHVRKVVFGGK